MRLSRFFKNLSRWRICCATLLSLSLPVLAAEIRLKNGMILRGIATQLPDLNVARQQLGNKNAIQANLIVMVTDDLRRYFVADRQIARVDREQDPTLKDQEVFNLKPPPKEGVRQIQTLGSILKVTPWDEFGRRSLKIKFSPRDIDVFQAITQITPEHVKITSFKGLDWELALPITSIPPETLDKMLRTATEDANDQHHLAIARFYIQAGMYARARDELRTIQSRFPDLSKRAAEVTADLQQAEGREILGELKLRQAAGQYQFVHHMLRMYPREKADAPLRKEIEANLKIYELMKEARELIVSRLGDLQTQLNASELDAEVGRYRAEIIEKLDAQNFGRLEPFVRLGGEKDRPVADRLALGLSGWIVGSANAENNLPLALRMWQARFIIQQYLRSENPNDREARLAELEKLDGITAARVAQILALVPPIVDTQLIEPGKPTRVQVSAPGDKLDIHYSVQLPPEYHPDHSYPVIVALTDQGAPPERELSFWAGTPERQGQAARHGYIVIAPDYMDDNGSYDYNPLRHRVVLESMRDAQRRFNVDSDRVFLSGHGRGGDATFDIALSHPDLFAGAIPISGVTDNKNKECKNKYYWQNAKTLPIYAISGELDRQTFELNSRDFNRMLTRGANGYDVMLADFRGYGRDSFYAEIHKLFTWMSLHRRPKPPAEISNYTMRPEDNRFHWLQMSGLPASTNRAMNVTGHVMPGANAIRVHANAGSITLWLTPDLIKLDKKLDVTINGQVKWTKPVKPDLKAMLEDFRYRGDRQNLYWAVLEF